MRALILCAGLGERMRPLTWSNPKPLLRVGAQSLVQRHLERLAAIGVREAVINTAWLAHRFPESLGGEACGVRLQYSFEGSWPLETGGGIRAALPLLGEDPFICLNGDIWSEFPLGALPRTVDHSAHLLLRPLPPFRQAGPFESLATKLLPEQSAPHTFAGYAVYRPDRLQGLPHRGSIVDWWLQELAAQRISVDRYDGPWEDVGTVERLQVLQNQG
ncbi:mannose-1-phosphate guanylyltransferase [Ahniella affigens]|uniref:Mannose-1-phosphate guanylyltransferase n=1 Tax=Ahniella affigens TaxID=2021234 RepID=A0A2P1PVV1_9GAMM|nr:nucleotidyltransferase family protein [Ahniella affigens]AVP98976.1 mannose-1-phosphate guanylyltransferase [Ahniella affigens]